MSDVITREEFNILEARVRVVEREVDGEKLVSRHTLEQSRRNGDDLPTIKVRMDRVEQRLEGVEKGLHALEHKVDDLKRSLPEIVSAAMREVLGKGRA